MPEPVLAAYGLAPDTPEPKITAHLFKLYVEMTKSPQQSHPNSCAPNNRIAQVNRTSQTCRTVKSKEKGKEKNR